MSNNPIDHIKTPYEQLPTKIREALVQFYMDEEKFDLIEMYLHSCNVMDISAMVESLPDK